MATSDPLSWLRDNIVLHLRLADEALAEVMPFPSSHDVAHEYWVQSLVRNRESLLTRLAEVELEVRGR